MKVAFVPSGDIFPVATPILTFPHQGEGTFEIVSNLDFVQNLYLLEKQGKLT